MGEVAEKFQFFPNEANYIYNISGLVNWLCRANTPPRLKACVNTPPITFPVQGDRDRKLT